MGEVQDVFAKLPSELLLKIVSCFIPYDVRTLRYIIIACKDSNRNRLRIAAERVLEDQKAWLLDRWKKIPAKTPAHPGSSYDLMAISEAYIGKQYVRRETIHKSDKWVSLSRQIVMDLETPETILIRLQGLL